MYDTLTRIGESVVQHGKFNDRVYLLKLAAGDFPGIIPVLINLAQTNHYSKIIAKVPAGAKDAFIERGFTAEAFIAGFYKNHEDAYFLGRFFSPARKDNPQAGEIKAILEAALLKATDKTVIKPDADNRFDFSRCTPTDAAQMAEVYQQVFLTYPSPIHDPRYIVGTMDQDSLYFAVWEQGNMVALASADLDRDSGTAEMTDFATLPEYWGRNLSLHLLRRLETEVSQRKIRTVYSIARSLSWGMNITFARTGYRYGGTLVNNTNISGSFESMNIWYKHL